MNHPWCYRGVSLQETANCLPLTSEGKEEIEQRRNTPTELKLILFFLSEQIPFRHENKNNKINNNKTQDRRRAKFALHIFKHCWFGSQPWTPVVAYALYTLYFKSISAMAGQPEGKAWNFPLKQKRTHCSEALCFKLTPAFLLSCVKLTGSGQSHSTSVIVFKDLEIVSDL